MHHWYHKLVEKVFGQQQIVERLFEEETEGEGLEFKPFITVSRDPGSGGRPIAKVVSEKLGFDFYNKKLLQEIAKSAKLRKEIIWEVDEKQRTAIQDFIHNALNPDYISESTYMKHLVKVILHLAQRGNVVLLGRGSNFITPNALGLHVRITAPYRVCVSRAVQYEEVPYQKAREIISKVAEERAGFIQQYFGKDITNPKYYDLVLNTTYYTIEEAAELIVQAFKTKFPQA